MCGIAGIISFDTNNVNLHRLRQMTDAIAHRGPEGDGFWINDTERVSFGHRRLSIIDLSDSGAQPMHYMQRYTITYNGEIYNYIELKADLEKRGYAFHSECDTEVILAAYACYGTDCLEYFDGMFAFALWDNVESTLYCARDRFGEKPFYYHFDGEQLLFASEMKALWAAGISRQIDNSMLLDYLAIGYTSNPADPFATFYQQIQKLPAAHYMQVKLDSTTTQLAISFKQYWDIDKETLTDKKEDQLISIGKELFETSVRRRLRSDVPIGSSLSGGLDSSGVVAAIHYMLPANSTQKTFSAVFPGYAKDESKFIRLVAEHFKLDNYTTTPTAEGFTADLPTLMHHQEEPFQSSSIYAQYKVYELAKQHGVTVILDGQGADEILAGYNKYYHWYWQQLVSTGKWNLLKSEQQAARANGVQAGWSWKNYAAAYMPALAARQLEKKAHQQQRHPFFKADFVQEYAERKTMVKPVVTKLNDILYHDTMQLGLEELLRYADRNSLAHSREVRLPFLNHQFVEFIFALPAHFKIRDGYTKYFFRKIMEPVLPVSITWRKDKVGYEPPQQEWMQKSTMKELVMESRKKLAGEGVLKQSVLAQPVASMPAHEANNFDWRYLCAVGCLYDR